jgi:hypothetical protein
VHVEAARKAFTLIGFYVLFQLAVSVSDYLMPSGELAGLTASEKLNLFAAFITSLRAFVNPFGVAFVYLAAIKWVLVDRRAKLEWAASAAYYVIFGVYYGVLFSANLNGRLHGQFDRSLGINPGPLVSAMFPLTLAFVLPLFVTLLVSIVYKRLQRAGKATV